MGTILTRHGLPNVYGTMEWPLNALTLPHNMPLLKTVEKKILPHRHRCRHRKSGAKRSSHADRRCTLPRFSLRRQLPPVGHLHITGVFDNLTHPSARTLLPTFCYPLTYAILSLQNEPLFPPSALFNGNEKSPTNFRENSSFHTRSLSEIFSLFS